MRKKILLQLPGAAEPAVASCQGRSRLAAVVDAKSELGGAMAASLAAAGFEVAALSAARPEEVPAECGVVLYCHDAAAEPNRHLAGLDALCGALAATRTAAGAASQVHVCLFTPASAFAGDGPRVREAAAPRPHSLRELVCAQAELSLQSWCFRTRTAILPQLFRHGELYGVSAGHVAECLRRAQARQPLTLPGLGAQKRTLTHVEDLADAAAALLKKDFAPSPVNLPGETLAVIDYMSPIADRYGVELAMGRDACSEAFPWGLGDCVLATAAFKAELPAFRPKHRFREWLQTNA